MTPTPSTDRLVIGLLLIVAIFWLLLISRQLRKVLQMLSPAVQALADEVSRNSTVTAAAVAKLAAGGISAEDLQSLTDSTAKLKANDDALAAAVNSPAPVVVSSSPGVSPVRISAAGNVVK